MNIIKHKQELHWRMFNKPSGGVIGIKASVKLNLNMTGADPGFSYGGGPTYVPQLKIAREKNARWECGGRGGHSSAPRSATAITILQRNYIMLILVYTVIRKIYLYPIKIICRLLEYITHMWCMHCSLVRLWCIFQKIHSQPSEDIHWFGVKIEYHEVGDTWCQQLLSYGTCVWPM